jgi:predicted molibdopterin-dependent oxidoreductase YjgC
VDGQWKVVEWDKALEFAVRGLVNNALNADGGNKLGALASNTATLEEVLQYLLQNAFAMFLVRNEMA